MRFLIIFISILTFNSAIYAQQEIKNNILVNGTVRDSENIPIKGANIYVDSVKTRIKTNKKGHFNIIVKSKSKLLSVFSRKHGLLNYNYNGEQKIDFVFPKDHKIVTVKELTQLGYIASIQKGNKKNQGYDQYIDIYQLLKERFPEVQVYGKSITIRGKSSLVGSNTPLIVVNGAVVGANSLSSISPIFIESIEILKGTNTGLYGARGANGVIKIKLK